MLAKIFKSIDLMLWLVIISLLAAILVPARGDFATIFAAATSWIIAFLFFLYGARLSTRQALAGLTHWRLHLTILSFTFILFPIIGVLLTPLKYVVGDGLYAGILYLTLVPSTIQASVAFTSIARGNVAGAIVSASLSSLVGVVATPLLAMLLMNGGHVQISGKVFVDIAVQIFLPFVLGQLVQKWVGPFARTKVAKWTDKLTVMMVVYSAFSASMVAGIWTSIAWWQVVLLIAIAVALVALMLWLTSFIATRLGFNRADRVAIMFCGSKKSLAAGLPMATIIFGAGTIGLLILPLMIFHQIQLMMCAWLAGRLSHDPLTPEELEAQAA